MGQTLGLVKGDEPADAAKVATELADRVVEVVSAAARTGQIGDGKIFVTNIDHALRIRTGETDGDAL